MTSYEEPTPTKPTPDHTSMVSSLPVSGELAGYRKQQAMGSRFLKLTETVIINIRGYRKQHAMGLRFCSSCGNQLTSAGSRFCSSCGNQLTSALESQTDFAPQPSYPEQPYQPINPTPYHPHTNAEQPSYMPTVLITLFFGIFGMIPAVRHSAMAKTRGYSQKGYWLIFGVIVGLQIWILILLLPIIVPVLNILSFLTQLGHLFQS